MTQTQTKFPRQVVDSDRGWIVVAATTLSTFTVFGVTNSFSTFFSSMSDEFNAGRGATALMYGVTIFLVFLLGLPAGRVADRVGARPVVAAGALFMGGGLLATSAVQELWLGYVTYGVGVGLGVACGYVPMVASVSRWFARRRATALGVAVSGTGLGTLVVPPLANALIDEHGWRWTYRVFAAVSAAALMLVAALAARAPAASDAAASSLRTALAQPVFRRLYLAVVLTSIALFVPFVFIQPYAEDHGVGSSRAAALVSVLGLGGLLGRLVLGGFAVRIGAQRLYLACFGLIALSFAIWAVSRDQYGVLAVFAALLGVAYGGYVALAPAVVAELFGVAAWERCSAPATPRTASAD